MKLTDTNCSIGLKSFFIANDKNFLITSGIANAIPRSELKTDANVQV